VSNSTVLIIIWTVSIFPVYVQWHMQALGRPWGALPGWVLLLEYGCVAAAGAMIVWRRSTRRATVASGANG
jgi:alpha-1,6-mannosyltransferase